MDEFSVGLLVAGSLASIIFMMSGLVKWARRRSSSAMAVGAFLALFAPDPTLENSIKLAEESKQVQREEDEEGEDKDAG